MTLPKDPVKAAAYKERIRQARTGTKASEATKRKMSESRSGEKNHNCGGNPELIERCRKNAAARVGTHATVETLERKRQAMLKYYELHPEACVEKSLSQMGKNNPNYGKTTPDEVKAKMSIAKQGERHPNFGKHHSPETIEKIRVANSGENCYHYGQSPSDETRRRMSEALKGDKCYNWKGGITAVNHSIRTCLQYREWIMSVFKRDDFTCQDCGATKVYLHAHHIRLFSDIMQEYSITSLEEALLCDALWDVSNGRSLCELCHKREHFGVADEGEEPMVAEAGG